MFAHTVKQAVFITISLYVYFLGEEMSALTHKFGLELDLTSPEAQHPDHKNGLESKLRRKIGVIYAEFSKEHPDIVVIEFDPLITTPDEVYKKIRRLNGEIKRKVFM